MRIVWLFFLIVPLLANGQQTIISGVAPLSAGEEIQLRVFDDPISGKERVLAKQIIGVDGSFELKVLPHEVQYAFLQVGKNCADFFIERNKSLELTFVPPKWDENRPEAFYQRHFFMPKITGGTTAKLNEQIISFNDTLDAFMEALYPMLMQRRSPKVIADKLTSFEEYVLIESIGSQSFVVNYIKYSIANVEQTYLTDRKQLFDKYLKGQKSQLDNPAYIDFVVQFYQGLIEKTAIVNRHDEWVKALDRKEAFAGLEQILMEEEPQLKATSIGRIILIKGMDELFGQKDFEDEKLIKALKDFSVLSSNSYHANAAKNIAAKHENLSEGAMAPDIVFKDLDGAEKRLSDFQGTYVFLELTDATNAYCQRETNVVSNLKNEFKNVRFVTVCIGNSGAEMEALQQKMHIDWEFGGIPFSASTLEDYQIKSLPLFYIINPEGRFYRVPVKDPSKGAQTELMALEAVLKEKGKQRVGK